MEPPPFICLLLILCRKRQHNEELDCCSVSFPLSFLSAFKYRFEKSRILTQCTKQTQCRHFSQSIVRSYNDILSSSGMCFLNSIDIVGNVVWNINYRYMFRRQSSLIKQMVLVRIIIFSISLRALHDTRHTRPEPSHQ